MRPERGSPCKFLPASNLYGRFTVDLPYTSHAEIFIAVIRVRLWDLIGGSGTPACSLEAEMPDIMPTGDLQGFTAAERA